jgi:hypothetical protein
VRGLYQHGGASSDSEALDRNHTKPGLRQQKKHVGRRFLELFAVSKLNSGQQMIE